MSLLFEDVEQEFPYTEFYSGLNVTHLVILFTILHVICVYPITDWFHDLWPFFGEFWGG